MTHQKQNRGHRAAQSTAATATALTAIDARGHSSVGVSGSQQSRPGSAFGAAQLGSLVA